jgi:hypothetical protein
MKTKSSAYCIVALALCVILTPGITDADVPMKTAGELLSSASQAGAGTVVAKYSRTEKKDNYEYTYNVVEITVSHVAKGKDIAPNDRVFVRCWDNKWVGPPNQAPIGDSGHFPIPSKGDKVEVYVGGSRGTGFDVLHPNGFFKVVQPKKPGAQGSADQPATASESKSAGEEEANPESEERPR